jgi:hypothetical protein
MQQTRHARRIYIGGIGENCTEQSLQDFFEDTLKRVCEMCGSCGSIVLKKIRYGDFFLGACSPAIQQRSCLYLH